MKKGSKYYPLFEHLCSANQPEITLTIPDIEALINGRLPATAWSKRAWWSNRSKGALQASAWINAGYHTEGVDLQQQTVTFRKFEAEYTVQQIDGKILWDRSAIKALRIHMGLTQAEFASELGVRQQTISEWENGVYGPTRSTSKHLELVAEKAKFMYGEKEQQGEEGRS